MLKRGTRGARVRALQTSLKRLGYVLVVDGVFGRQTESAVKRFQRAHGLEPDGIVGAKTAAAIAKELAKKPSTIVNPGPIVFLDVGHIGKASNPGDRGARYKSLTEASYYIDALPFIKDALRSCGVRVTAFPDDYHDTLMDYPERNRKALAVKAKLYVQLHLNSAPAPGDYGKVLYISDSVYPTAKRISDKWNELSGIKTTPRKLLHGERGYACIAACPDIGVVFEPLFINNERHYFMLTEDAVKTARLMGLALAAGV